MTEYRVEKWNKSGAPDAGELMDRMRGEGYGVFQWSDGPGAVYSDHEHGEDQSHWIISGSLELTVRGFGKVVLNPGDRDFMPAGTVHAARVLGDQPVVYLIGAKSRAIDLSLRLGVSAVRYSYAEDANTG